jgi:hypothetical protein
VGDRRVPQIVEPEARQSVTIQAGARSGLLESENGRVSLAQ